VPVAITVYVAILHEAKLRFVYICLVTLWSWCSEGVVPSRYLLGG